MALRTLEIGGGFDPRQQWTCGLFAAQLDDQSQRLKESVEGLSVEQLEWQHRPGMNTIGMLLAHIAVAEVYWMAVAPVGMKWGEESDQIMLDALRIRGDDDGLPLPDDGVHPDPLRGKGLKDYLAMLDGARKITHNTLTAWEDTKLEQTYRLGENDVSYGWTAYHILEHLSGHFGQILLIKHLMKASEG